MNKHLSNLADRIIQDAESIHREAGTSPIYGFPEDLYRRLREINEVIIDFNRDDCERDWDDVIRHMLQILSGIRKWF